jgi:diguanylate cyclase (GGDEF)-like protein
MDSAVYLTIIFVYGTNQAMLILLISSVIKFIYDRKTSWWKQLLNFTMYVIMVFCASHVYRLFGGTLGPFDVNHFYSYMVCLAVYFLINASIVGLYYYILFQKTFYVFIRHVFKDTLFAYINTLLLSVVLVVLINDSKTVGLFLFLAIGLLISHAFRKLFNLYNSISEKANTDQRTGLYSHSYFEEKLNEYLKSAREQKQPLSLVMVDLDDFKKYNDAFGHPQGDKLLGFFGQLVKSQCEPKGLFAARYGGEEFAIIMPGYPKDQARAFIDQFRKQVNDTPFEGVEVFPHGCVSFSAGIIEINRETFDKSQLIEWADRALYAAKAKGKNTVFIYGEESRQPLLLRHDIHELEQQLKIFLYKDVYTYKHSKRVFAYAMEMAEYLDLRSDDRRQLVLGALIHDIGKLEIPRDILNKKSKLTGDEWEIVKKHVLWGREIISVTPKFKDLVPMVEFHHERYDGQGYPNGLKGEEIPKLARLLSIIDSFDAMTTERPYQDTKTFNEALQEIRRCAGTQFDPELADQFIVYMQGKLEHFPGEAESAAGVEENLDA